MSALWFALYLACLFSGGTGQMNSFRPSVHVPLQSRFISVHVGENVTLKCVYEGAAGLFYWYKHTLGERIVRISTFYRPNKSGTLHNQFNTSRFALDTGNDANHLIISDLKISDSAIYYCAASSGNDLEFAEGIHVSVKGSGGNHQSKTVQPRGSKSVNCTLYTGTSNGEHVHWFQTSDEDHPGIIYTHGGSNNQSERKQTQQCVYNLPITSLDSSHAGTYYCAVASCGHLFGNTDVGGGGDSLMLVYLLSGGLTFTTILVVLLAYKIYSMSKSSCCRCTDADCKERPPEASVYNAQELEDADVLHYAAIKMNRTNRATKQRVSKRNECVYSSVRQLDGHT